MSAMNGLSAMRSGYFTSSPPGGRPLAVAVTTYCFCSSSSRFARSRRIMRGRARGADHDHRHPQVLRAPRRPCPSSSGWSRIVRVHQAADRGPEPDVGEIEQHQRQQEVRRREAEEAEEGEAVVAPAVLVRGRIDADRERHHPGEEHGGEARSRRSGTAGRRSPRSPAGRTRTSSRDRRAAGRRPRRRYCCQNG